jgi:hypothetical protein
VSSCGTDNGGQLSWGRLGWASHLNNHILLGGESCVDGAIVPIEDMSQRVINAQQGVGSEPAACPGQQS